jgi:hypothetical protein
MSTASRSKIPRTPLASTAAALCLALLGGPGCAEASTKAGAVPQFDEGAVRRFQVHFPNEALIDLRRRLGATRWPGRELSAINRRARHHFRYVNALSCSAS